MDYRGLQDTLRIVQVGIDEVGEAVTYWSVNTVLVAHTDSSTEVSICAESNHIPVRMDKEVCKAEVLTRYSIMLGTDHFERPELDQRSPIVTIAPKVPNILRTHAIAEHQVFAEILGETDGVTLFECSQIASGCTGLDARADR